jgi:hypothetical protein
MLNSRVSPLDPNNTTKKTYKIKVGDIIKYSVNSITGYLENVKVLFISDGINPASPNGKKGCLAGSSGKYLSSDNYGNPFSLNDEGAVLAGAATWSTGSTRVFYGYAYSNISKIIAVTAQDLSINPYNSAIANATPTEFLTAYYLPGKLKITTVSYRNGELEVKAGSIVDINTYKAVGSTCSRVIAITRYGDPTQLIVINGEVN